MFRFQGWLDSFDTEGGRTLLLLSLFVIGILMAMLKVTKAEDVIVGAFAALLTNLQTSKKS